ncbi:MULTISPECIES: DUF461 domain-containing protein [unclassified Streptomyces]|uniref:DUF461 domain-containing protein n=1 Tax=unclassified Streptomyces TaxID=2593676 RepID=UPI002365F082|nr:MULTISPECIES: DUF461 domain-containing protein [unclassified Streptomyces]MDF3142906.1 DUF461 domain-containing protein [Streptomyces sp. T21Q-yed]WDF39223.1 DUF461 domain-containing protein [Streptomyces sp. T12]
MSSSLRRGALAAAAIAFSITSLGACAAGNNSQTLEIKPDNAATTVGDIKIQNAIVITQPDLESTGPAAISATLFNSGRTAQTLDAIKVDGTDKTAELKPAKGGSLTIPAGGSLILGGKDNASALLPSSREAVQDGNAQKITFTFSKTGDVSLRAFVVPAEHYFESWGPTEVPSVPGKTSSPTASPTGSPAEGTPAGPNGEASASATSAEGNAAGTGSGAGAATPSDSASQTTAGH